MNGRSHPVFTPQPLRITALWPVLISRFTEGRRLSWPVNISSKHWLLVSDLYLCWPSRLPFLDDGSLVQQQTARASVDVTHDEVVLATQKPRTTATTERRAADVRPQTNSSIHGQDVSAGRGDIAWSAVVQYPSYDDP